MQLKELFLKPIDRPIEGVIKADDLQHLHTEIDEYVITDEVARHLETFLGVYGSNYSGGNGVWISGFFGSGKSHLLKMLAYLLENRPVDGLNIAQSFKEKVAGNAILQAEINRASDIPSESILFNIDQKADTTDKDKADAVLGVFVRVFNEHCGYFGKQPYLAQFERDLDREGLLEPFKASFMRIKGESWERGRETPIIRKGVIAEAYAEVTGNPPDFQLLDSYSKDYRMSIDDFANMVNEYIQAQGNRFRLNFFVDEVGQYIADNTKLMTNLQSIAESLATHCRGRAWIVVTAQQEMGKVVHEFKDRQANDFSKIQARFSTKMNLSSKNVEEVIQRRLLTKTDPAKQALQRVYTREKDNFGTWFTFTETTQTQRNIRDAEHFIQSYPFVPYQFDLFQQAMERLSSHDAFEGKYSSVGERSMLAVFQEVARSLSDEELPALATFDQMFDGLRTTLKSTVLRSIQDAERKIEVANPFAIRVLKVLFLIKYIGEFKSSLENVVILLYPKINENTPELKKKVQQALGTLQRESYIKRNPDASFEYLTNEEQDVELEIKSVSINNEDLLVLLGHIVFDDILKDKRITSDSGKESYLFNKRVDQVSISRGETHELTIHLVSPFDGRSADAIKLDSSGKSSDLFVMLVPEEDVMASLRLYKQTDQYIKLTKNNNDTKQQIIIQKGTQNAQLRDSIIETIKLAFASSQTLFIINGSEVSFTDGKTPNAVQARFSAGFHELVRQTYTNLSMIQRTDYRTQELSNLSMVPTPNETLDPLTEAEREVLNYINNLDKRGETVAVKRVIDTFSRKPYGWYEKAIWFQLGYLCQKGKVEVRQDSNLLGLQGVLAALKQSTTHPRLLLKPTQEFNPSQVRQLKEWYQDLFDEPAPNSEAKALAEHTQHQLRAYLDELRKLHQQRDRYPFLNQLATNIKHLEGIVEDHDYGWYLTDFVDSEGGYLLDNHTDLIALIRGFMNGTQREIYDRATAYYHEQRANLAHADATLTRDIERALKDDAVFRGNALQKIKQQVEQLHTQIEAERTATLNAQRTRLEQMWDRLTRHSGFAHLRDTDQRAFEQTFTDCLDKLNTEQVIAVIKETVALFEEREFPSLLNKLERARPIVPLLENEDAHADTPTPITPPKPVMVSARELVASLNLARPTLTNEAELDRYLNQLRQRFLTELQNGKHIQLKD